MKQLIEQILESEYSLSNQLFHPETLLCPHSYKNFCSTKKRSGEFSTQGQTPIDLLQMDSIFSPHFPDSLIHITAWPVTLNQGKYLWDWHFHLEINYMSSKCPLHLRAFALCPEPHFHQCSIVLKIIRISVSHYLFFFYIEIMFVCITSCLSIKFWHRSIIILLLLYYIAASLWGTKSISYSSDSH